MTDTLGTPLSLVEKMYDMVRQEKNVNPEFVEGIRVTIEFFKYWENMRKTVEAMDDAHH